MRNGPGANEVAGVKADDTFTRQVINTCHEILSTLDCARDELNELAERNHGPKPEGAHAGAEPRPLPNGRFAEIEILLMEIGRRSEQLRVDCRAVNITH